MYRAGERKVRLGIAESMYGKVSGAGGGVSGKRGVKLAANAVDVSIKKKKFPWLGLVSSVRFGVLFPAAIVTHQYHLHTTLCLAHRAPFPAGEEGREDLSVSLPLYCCHLS